MDGSVPAPPRTKVTAEAVRSRKAELAQADPGAQQSAAAWFRGVLRLPDFFSRLHASGVIDTLGAGLVLFGLLLQAESLDVALRLVLIFFFLLFTVPTATHALAKSALQGGLEPEVDDDGGASSNS